MSRKLRDLTYWEIRAIEEEQAIRKDLKHYHPLIVKAYNEGLDYLNREIQKIYKRQLNKRDLTEDEIEKILNTTASAKDLLELQRLSKSIKDKEVKKQVRDYLNVTAAKHRITMLETLKAKAFITAKKIADVQHEQSTSYFIKSIHRSHNQAAAEAIIGKTEEAHRIYETDNYIDYRTENKKPVLEIKDIKNDKVIKTIELEHEEQKIDPKEISTTKVKSILETNWHGSNYSKRIWKDTDALASRLQELFTARELSGMSYQEMSRKLKDEFGVALGVAERLIRTEANYVAGQAKLKAWEANGVKQYTLIAVLDLRTSNICKSKDGKIYTIREAVVNGKYGTYPPFHPWCRTVAVAYFGERTLKGNRVANDPIAGKTFEIRKKTNYQEWEQMLIDKHGKIKLENERKKIRNYKTDKEQYSRYKAVLGVEAPETFNKFQELKYNDQEAYERLKERYRHKKLQNSA